MNKVKDFRETTWSDLIITEAVDEKTGEKRMRIVGQVQEADVINKNGRLYSRDVLGEAVVEIQPNIKAGRVFGEVDHPDVLGRLSDSSHLLQKLWWKENRSGKETNRLMGEVMVFNTPAGEIIKEIVRAGGRPGFSSRGHGDSTRVKVRGVKGDVEKIDKGFRLESFDIVIDPSVPRAQIHKIIESATKGSKNSKTEVVIMDLEELKVKHPELYAEMKKELKQTHLKEFNEDADKIKKDTETEGELEKLKARVRELEKEQDDKDADIDKHLDALADIVQILRDGGYISTEGEDKGDGDDDGEDEEKDSLAKDLATALAKIQGIEKDKEATDAELNTIKEDVAQKEVDNYLLEKTQDEPFGTLFRERLKDCKTKEEVDEGIKNYKEFASTVVSDESDVVEGKGKGEKTKETDDDDAQLEQVKSRAKGAAGILVKKEDGK